MKKNEHSVPHPVSFPLGLSPIVVNEYIKANARGGAHVTEKVSGGDSDI